MNNGSGPAGQAGEQGEHGEQGEAGAHGEQGEAGEHGEQGEAGEQAEQGEAGGEGNSEFSEQVGRAGQFSPHHDQAAGLGHRTWVFPAGHIPTSSTGAEPEFTSREELCILNPSPQDVTAEIEVLLSDAEPLGPFTLEVAGRRVRHVRINDLFDPVPVPLGVPYGLIVRTEHPVVAQVVRTDTRREGLTSTTMTGYGTA